MKTIWYHRLIGFVFGVIIVLLISIFQLTDTTNKIAVFGIIANTVVLVVIATFLNKNENNSNSLKGYFINEVKLNRDKYLTFIERIQNSQISKQEITSKFKIFSEDFIQMSGFIKTHFNYETAIQKENRKIHLLICGNDYFDSLKPDDIFVLNKNDKIALLKELKDLKYLLINLIIQINLC